MDNSKGAVGYGRPPRHTQFKKGQSGNPAGRPGRKAGKQVDVAAILETPISVKQGDSVSAMHPFEVLVRQLLRQAIQGKNLPATLEFLRLCKKYKLLGPPDAPPAISPVQYLPKDWDRDEWLVMFERYGRPPWPGPRNGLCKTET